MKKKTSFTLSEVHLQRLKVLAERYSLSQAQMLELLIQYPGDRIASLNRYDPPFVPSSEIKQQHANDTPEQLLTALGGWVDVAAFHLRNEEYWRERALKAEGKTPEEIADWGH